MYAAVPTTTPVAVSVVPEEPEERARAMPKSASSAWPSDVSRMFSGFTSRCTIPLLVRKVQRQGNLACDADRILETELRLPAQALAQRFSLHVRHREPQISGVRLAGVEYRQDVGVLQRGGEADLSAKALGSERGGQVLMQDLERNLAAMLGVARQVDGRHPTTPQLALQGIGGAKGIL